MTMREIVKGLWVGNRTDYDEAKDRPDWSFLLAARDPWHRRLLGYSGRAAPEDDPEYYYARRDHTLYLNLVDSPLMIYIPSDVINAALAFIAEEWGKFRSVLIACNKGESRSPTLAMLFMRQATDLLNDDYALAREQFRALYYPEYKPAGGMAEYARFHWHRLVT